MHEWSRQPVAIPTRWAADVSPDNVWFEYPRPQLVRPHWQSLNGLWEYAITPLEASSMPSVSQGRILVPFPIESALSGVAVGLKPDQLLWYRRVFSVEPTPPGDRVLLHFGAVDYEAAVYVNGKWLGTHSGGYQSFTYDITDALTDREGGRNELVVKVWDPTDQGPNPYGKQRLRAEWAFYAASSGIWQTVWTERVPATYVEKLKMTPDVDYGVLRLEVTLAGAQPDLPIEAVVTCSSEVVTRQRVVGATDLRIAHPRLWSPDDPFLYDLNVRVLDDKGRSLDEVKSYFGMRKIEAKQDEEGRARMYLNGTPVYNLGVVDQGYWPDGLYTAPTDAALKFDIQAIKALGFNTVRKHIKIEPARWYAHCDKLGVLVWQDMPSGNNDSEAGRDEFERELAGNLEQLHNSPCIVVWGLFNEGWGAYDEKRLTHWMKAADPSRLLNAHSGPYDQLAIAQSLKRRLPSQLPGPFAGATDITEEFQAIQQRTPWPGGDMIDYHYYPGPRMPPAEGHILSVTGEHGSFGAFIPGHVSDELRSIGTGLGATRASPTQLYSLYEDSVEQMKLLQAKGLAASQYFQLYDVETEQQGFMTYDREIAKLPFAHIARLNATLTPPAANLAAVTQGFAIADADCTPETERLRHLAKAFEEGRRDLPLLRQLTLIALRQNDQLMATQAGNAFAAHADQPYSVESWKLIAAATRTSRDAGFELMRTQADEVNAALGPNAVQRTLLNVIRREFLDPWFRDPQRALDWETMQAEGVTRYGELAREAVRGARMMHDLVRSDWVGFARAYAKYYASALGRSAYVDHALAYQVLKNVDDARALEAALRVMEYLIDQVHEFKFGRYDASELDTYANLLYKLGRTSEALQWQQKAVALSEGRDTEITRSLDKMKAEAPTW